LLLFITEKVDLIYRLSGKVTLARELTVHSGPKT